MWICAKCGHSNNGNFCQKCGNKKTESNFVSSERNGTELITSLKNDMVKLKKHCTFLSVAVVALLILLLLAYNSCWNNILSLWENAEDLWTNAELLWDSSESIWRRLTVYRY